MSSRTNFGLKRLTKFISICFCTHQGAVIPGPPFLFGACIVLMSFLVALFIPEYTKGDGIQKHSNSISGNLTNSPERGCDEDIEPLLRDSSIWELASFEEPGNQCTELWTWQKRRCCTCCLWEPLGSHTTWRLPGAGGEMLVAFFRAKLDKQPSASLLFLLLFLFHSLSSSLYIRKVKIWNKFLQTVCNSQIYLESKFWNTKIGKTISTRKDGFPSILLE